MYWICVNILDFQKPWLENNNFSNNSYSKYVYSSYTHFSNIIINADFILSFQQYIFIKYLPWVRLSARRYTVNQWNIIPSYFYFTWKLYHTDPKSWEFHSFRAKPSKASERVFSIGIYRFQKFMHEICELLSLGEHITPTVYTILTHVVLIGIE